jgi:hypothetical protein
VAATLITGKQIKEKTVTSPGGGEALRLRDPPAGHHTIHLKYDHSPT